MKLKSILFIGSLSIALFSCSPRISTNLFDISTSLTQNDEVIVLNLEQEYPEDYKELGVVKINDTGFSVNCKYERIIELAKAEARKAGGNVLKITEHEKPSFTGSSCDQIKAFILKVDDINNVVGKAKIDEQNLDRDYAALYIYRKRSGQGGLIGYPIYYGDSALCYVKNNFKREFKIYNLNSNTIWARTETKQVIPIMIEKGKDYYIRCGIKMGMFVGQPNIVLVDNLTGRAEYNAIVGSGNINDLIVLTNGKRIECNIIDENKDQVTIKQILNEEITTSIIDRFMIKDIVYAE